MTRTRVLAAALLCGGLIGAQPPTEAVGQVGDSAGVAGRAGELLAAGDTAAALLALRERVRDDADDGRAWLDLGRVLAAQATEVESDIEARLEAKKALEKALDLRPDDPFALLEYGLLLRKQQVGVDAIRVLERAWRAADERAGTMPPADRARLHYELGKVYESWWIDWQGLVQIPRTAQGHWSCGGVGSGSAADSTDVDATATGLAGRFGSFAVRCPPEWWEALATVVPIEELKAEDRDRMLRHFRLALAAHPGHVDAAVALLGHLADDADWTEYEVVARSLVEAAPDEARSHLFMGLGLHRQGRSTSAAEHFGLGIDLLEEEARGVFSDLTPLLPADVAERYREMDAESKRRSDETILASKDPLYLTEVNERALEHLARVAWAELKYSAPASETRGWDTEIGHIFIRYGEPVRALQCCYGGQTDMSPIALARFQYWSYGPTGPNFYFWRFRTRRRARLAETAKTLADNLTRVMPEAYRPVNPTATHPIPLQITRFRGARADLIRLELYAAVPLDSLQVAAGDSLQAGVFLFDQAHAPVWRRVHDVAVTDPGVVLTYRVEVPESTLRYAIEAREVGPDTLPRPVARVAGPVRADPFGPGLAISDLLLADLIQPRVEGASERDQLTIVPNRGLAFEALDPVHIYFEVYGLQRDGDGAATYEAELTVTEVSAEGRSLFARVLRGAVDLFSGGGDEQQSVRWERTALIEGDMAPDFLRIALPDLQPGSYRVLLAITDSATGRRVERERDFVVVPDAVDVDG
ncbi:MAG: GWxTD domain-containing protein [Gemmatimonadota bacterium]